MNLSFLITWHFWLMLFTIHFVLFRTNIIADIFYGIKTTFTKKKALICTAAASAYMFLRYLVDSSEIAFFLALPTVAVYTHFIFDRCTVKERAKILVTDYVFMFLLDMTAGLFPFFIKRRTAETIAINSLTFEIVAYILLGVFWLIKRYLLKSIIRMSARNVNRIFAVSGIVYIASGSVLLVSYVWYAPADERIYNMMLIMFPFALSTVAAFLINIYYTKTLKKSLEENERYSKNLEGLYETTRIFRHDYKNAMTVLSGYIDDGEIEKAREFLKQYTGEASFNDSVYIKSVSDIPDSGLKNLVISKLLAAKERGIKVNFTLSDDLKNPSISMKMYSELVGILLDNAIEASKDAQRPSISAELGNFGIHVVNTVREKVDTNSIFERGYSTKEGHSGLGMYRFRQIVKKNDNIEYFAQSENGEFNFEVKM